VTGVHRLEHVQRFAAAALPDDNAVRPHTQTVLHEVADRHGALAFDVGRSRFEAHHGIKYSASALTAAVELSARHISDRHLPDKAIDVIDEAGAAQRILPKSKQKKAKP
jgi:ATP-dependent Clp protease ATP-binding subunit ClpA